MLSLLLATLLLAPGPAVASSVLTARVRPLTDITRAILSEAARRSPTIEQIVFDLQQHDTIVFVELGWSAIEAGRTSMMSTTGSTRMLRIVISARLEPVRRIEILAHELHHALEVARDPTVRDGAAFRRLFERIGFAVSPTAYETDGAREVERRVRAELSRPRR